MSVAISRTSLLGLLLLAPLAPGQDDLTVIEDSPYLIVDTQFLRAATNWSAAPHGKFQWDGTQYVVAVQGDPWAIVERDILERRPSLANCVFDEFAPSTEPGEQLVGRGDVVIHTVMLSEFRGPWRMGTPIHELATLEALVTARLAPENSSWEDPTHWQFMRGIYWNDDPGALLFDDNESDRSSGLLWWRAFEDASTKARSDLRTDAPPDFAPQDLVGRTHFGDLQFLHAMRSYREQKREETQRLALDWCRFAWEVATLRTPVDADLVTAVAPSSISTIMAAYPAGTVSDVFCPVMSGRTPEMVRERALGSILHLLQDSYSSSHTVRVSDGAGGRPIQNFELFVLQDPEEHRRVDRQKQGPESIATCAHVLQSFARGDEWTALETWLRSGPLAIR